jgi:hypothetical protein
MSEVNTNPYGAPKTSQGPAQSRLGLCVGTILLASAALLAARVSYLLMFYEYGIKEADDVSLVRAKIMYAVCATMTVAGLALVVAWFRKSRRLRSYVE